MCCQDNDKSFASSHVSLSLGALIFYPVIISLPHSACLSSPPSLLHSPPLPSFLHLSSFDIFMPLSPLSPPSSILHLKPPPLLCSLIFLYLHPHPIPPHPLLCILPLSVFDSLFFHFFSPVCCDCIARLATAARADSIAVGTGRGVGRRQGPWG